jgi:hypothetical protein
MRRINKFLVLVLSVSLLAIADANAQLIVSKIPLPPNNIKQFAKPTKYHVWVSEEWVPGGKTYVYIPGRWGMAPVTGSTWKKGYWKKTPKGYSWVFGYWETKATRKAKG